MDRQSPDLANAAGDDHCSPAQWSGKPAQRIKTIQAEKEVAALESAKEPSRIILPVVHFVFPCSERMSSHYHVCARLLSQNRSPMQDYAQKVRFWEEYRDKGEIALT